MNNQEINKEIEKLSKEFKKNALDYFNAKGINVQLQKLIFTIQFNNVDSIIPLNENYSLKCKLNAQGQMVCKE